MRHAQAERDCFGLLRRPRNDVSRHFTHSQGVHAAGFHLPVLARSLAKTRADLRGGRRWISVRKKVNSANLSDRAQLNRLCGVLNICRPSST
jgi:hypothetical protein